VRPHGFFFCWLRNFLFFCSYGRIRYRMLHIHTPLQNTFSVFHTFFSSPVNVFRGVLNNKLFCVILVGTSALQAIIVQFGGLFMHVAPGGLSAEYWGLSLLLGLGSFPVQQIINVIYRIGENSTRKWRSTRRRNRARAMVAHNG
jgi:hypothetical protein